MTEREVESRVMPGEDADKERAARVRGRPFIKGTSGNPAGRPRGRFATGAPGDRLPGADRPTRAAILAEAYRLVTVEEGAEAVTLPANRAVFRALTNRALNGSQIAQRRWTEIVQKAELEQMQDQLAIYNVMERPPFGHEDEAYEDDILVDRRSGTVVIRSVGGVEEE
ncbi:hypothetical protein GCM10009087_55980 [Sphingomonas oligophenolica]|uniref:DUF5681 domain-containing protein n=1 Tax=Sphingomonas oligophenolica TaxID=301154 RepID=A0ABU9Y5G8_9SPHN